MITFIVAALLTAWSVYDNLDSKSESDEPSTTLNRKALRKLTPSKATSETEKVSADVDSSTSKNNSLRTPKASGKSSFVITDNTAAPTPTPPPLKDSYVLRSLNGQSFQLVLNNGVWVHLRLFSDVQNKQDLLTKWLLGACIYNGTPPPESVCKRSIQSHKAILNYLGEFDSKFKTSSSVLIPKENKDTSYYIFKTSPWNSTTNLQLQMGVFNDASALPEVFGEIRELSYIEFKQRAQYLKIVKVAPFKGTFIEKFTPVVNAPPENSL